MDVQRDRLSIGTKATSAIDSGRRSCGTYDLLATPLARSRATACRWHDVDADNMIIEAWKGTFRSQGRRSRERLTLSKNMKALAPFWTKAKYGKMSIEGRDLADTQTSHHSETRAIHDGKILVPPRSAKVPRNLKVRQNNRLDHCYSAPQAFPKSLRSFAVKVVVKQRPCFDQNVIRGHQCFTGLENSF